MTVRINQRTFYIVLGGVALAAALAVGILAGRLRSQPNNGSAAVPGAPSSVGSPPSALATVPLGTAPAAAANPTFQSLPKVEIEAAFQRFTAGDALFVDARVKTEYDMGHIAGAISLPEGEAAARFAELPKDKDLILYCA